MRIHAKAMTGVSISEEGWTMDGGMRAEFVEITIKTKFVDMFQLA